MQNTGHSAGFPGLGTGRQGEGGKIYLSRKSEKWFMKIRTFADRLFNFDKVC
jgi:hypothetical protein